MFSTFLANKEDRVKKPFFTGSLNTTFEINPNYTLDPDDGEALLEPGSFLFWLGFVYQINRRWLVSLHTGYDHHFRFGINAIPTFGKLTYNIMLDADGILFIN